MEDKSETISINFNKIPLHKWALITYMLGILLLILLLQVFGDMGIDITGNVISEKNIEPLIEEFVNTQLIPDGNVVIEDIREESGVYIAIISIDGQAIPTYFTKDGKFITQGAGLIPINDPQQLFFENN